MADNELRLSLEIPFPGTREAQIAYEVLKVDKEPPRSQVSKSITLSDNRLSVFFTAPTAKQLRVGVNGFLTHLMLVCETLEMFGSPVSQVYSHS